MAKLIVAPSRMQAFMIEKIDQEIRLSESRQGRPHYRQAEWTAGTGRGAGVVPSQSRQA